MSLDPSVFEKMGAFYLGRPHDLKEKQSSDIPLLYDSRDLLTHAVCVGMTGSGKTGLCLALLEEAAMDGIPAILVDPKGDLGNLLLTFPDLQGEDFRPWINEEDALREGVDPDDYAKEQAALWKKGLAAWGQSPERIRTLREKVDMAIYTPGSSAGLPINIMSSFAAPQTADPEALADRVQTAATSLLGLLKIDADPVKSREYLLLASILSEAWQAGRDLEISDIIAQIQNPPFEKIGVLNLETFYPAKERFELVMALNTMLAAPGFASWQEGESLDIGKMLFTTEGKPRLAIVSIAHLADSERMFFVSLLLNEMLAWTRAQSGTTSLRALLYMDEIFGYLPPTANPPSKMPLLTLLKQARAFGVGVILASQNPVDLDYKALSNAGTWFIGRLQTERDKARMLDGLQGAAAGGRFDRAGMESVLAGLGKRVFLMNNVHDDAPTVFETRWAMSYLRGPLIKEQIKLLMAKKKETDVGGPALPGDATQGLTAAENREPGFGGSRPTLPPELPQVFLKGCRSYRPVLLAAGSVEFRNKRLGVDESRSLLLQVDVPEGVSGPDWEKAGETRFGVEDLSRQPEAEAQYAALPPAGSRTANFKKWAASFKRALGSGQRLELMRCVDLKVISRAGENEADFRSRLRQTLREQRDDAVADLRKKYQSRIRSLQGRISQAESRVEREKAQASQVTQQGLISLGATVLGALLGSKSMGRATTTARSWGRSRKEAADVRAAEKNESRLREDLAEIEAEMEAEINRVDIREPDIEKFEMKPVRGGVQVDFVSLGWVGEG